MSRLDTLSDAVRARGMDPAEDNFQFNEVCKRHQGARFDISAEGGVFGPAYDDIVAFLDSCVTSALPTATHDRGGCVVSLPGAPDQNMHIDGVHPGLINAFVPLVNIDGTNGTEFVPGSHEPQVDRRPRSPSSRPPALPSSLAATPGYHT